jgi:hypothetical protein
MSASKFKDGVKHMLRLDNVTVADSVLQRKHKQIGIENRIVWNAKKDMNAPAIAQQGHQAFSAIVAPHPDEKSVDEPTISTKANLSEPTERASQHLRDHGDDDDEVCSQPMLENDSHGIKHSVAGYYVYQRREAHLAATTKDELESRESTPSSFWWDEEMDHVQIPDLAIFRNNGNDDDALLQLKGARGIAGRYEYIPHPLRQHGDEEEELERIAADIDVAKLKGSESVPLSVGHEAGPDPEEEEEPALSLPAEGIVDGAGAGADGDHRDDGQEEGQYSLSICSPLSIQSDWFHQSLR